MNTDKHAETSSVQSFASQIPALGMSGEAKSALREAASTLSQPRSNPVAKAA